MRNQEDQRRDDGPERTGIDSRSNTGGSPPARALTSSRRAFLAAGVYAGATLLAACDGSAAQPPQPAPEPPVPDPIPPAPPAPPPVVAPPPPAPPASSLSPAMQELQRYLAANASSPFALPAAADAPPTIRWAGALVPSGAAATSLPGGVFIEASSALVGGPLHDRLSASLPGNPFADGFPCLAISRAYVCKGNTRSIGTIGVLHFKTDAPIFEVAGVVPDGSATSVTMIVDGRLVAPRVLASGRGAGGWNVGAIRFEFGGRALRDIWLETSLYPAYLKIGATDTVLAADDAAAPQLTVVGDSFLAASSAAYANGSAIALELGARLGLRKVTVDAIGGTGYWNSGYDQGNLNDRLPAHAADNSAIYVVMAGLNDYGDVLNNPPRLVWPTRSDYEQAVMGYFAALRAAVPDALIVATAPLCPIPPMSDASYTVNPSTNTSGVGDFPYKADLHRRAVQAIAGPWVYIDALLGGGWLNSSGATGDVTNLQWFTGGTPAPGTSATYRPGNTNGGGGGAFGGIARVPLVSGGRYTQAPDVQASGGSGRCLLLTSTIDSTGALTSIHVVVSGHDYSSGNGLPTIEIDSRFELTRAVTGTPELMEPVNPDGQYPLPSFAPPGVDAAALNNIGRLLGRDGVHPSLLGVEYLARRLAENIHAAVLAL